MQWDLTRKRKELLNKEKKTISPCKGSLIRVALVYPNNYFTGMSSLGFQVIYELLNNIQSVSCERFFISGNKGDILSIETGTPLNDFDIIAFSISFELDYPKVVNLISEASLPVYSSQRDFVFPFIIAGGSFSFYNPEPMAPFFDSIILGEGEETLQDFINVIKEVKEKNLKDRDYLFQELKKIKGVYIPHLYTVNYTPEGYFHNILPEPECKKQWIKNLDNFRGSSCIVTEETEFKNMFLLEIARGCKNACAFCMIGRCFKPYRERSLGELEKSVKVAENLTSSIGIVAPSVGDYSELDSLCSYLINKNFKISFSSLRADTISPVILKALVSSGKKAITLAPETGSQTLRERCFKLIKNDAYYRAVELSLKEGLKNIRLYFMIGLPGEDMEDLEDMISFIKEIHIKSSSYPGTNIHVNINQFIPKPGTYFERESLENMGIMEYKIEFLRNKLKNYRNIKFKIESTKWSLIHAFLSLGDRKTSGIIYLISKYKKENFQDWRKALEEGGIDISTYVYRKKEQNEPLPWQHITS